MMTTAAQMPATSLALSTDELIELDRKHVWHPYAPVNNPKTLPCFPVESAKGCELTLTNGDVLVDGMSSWWACIHGYNHPVLNQAANNQIQNMSHVMFGGLTHEPAVRLAQRLVEVTPQPLQKVFFCDSGSVSIEVAMKMALQYWINKKKNTDSGTMQQQKSKFCTIRGGYHGDTFEAMSVCDPVNGMHHMFGPTVLTQQLFCSRPTTTFEEDALFDPDNDASLQELRSILEDQCDELAAVILEPIVQGAGGMRFYAPSYLKEVRALCDRYDVLLICDEIATGFGRTGKLFAMEHTAAAGDDDGDNSNDGGVVCPDILCLGKALSGGFCSFAATMTTDKVASQFDGSGGSSILMHGPTFMGNPLACAVSLASLELLETQDWQSKIRSIEGQLKTQLEECKDSPLVEDVRVLGAIGVVEMKEPLDMSIVQPQLVKDFGVWLRPFGKLLYTMPPFVIRKDQLRKITSAMVSIATKRIRRV